MSTCTADDCEKPVRARGLCSTHHRRLLRNGDLEPRRAHRAPDAECSVPGCVLRVKVRGWCEAHYARFRRRGSPEGPPIATPEQQAEEARRVLGLYGTSEEQARYG